jgi:hypothetical protein
MPAVLMTNPPPGLALAVIGNPPRGAAASHTTRRGKAMPAKAKTRSAKRRTNPSSLYWRVGAKTPWRTTPEAIVARDRATLQAQRHPGVVLPSVRAAVAKRSGKGGSKRATPKRAVAKRAAPAPLKLSVVAAKPTARAVTKRTRRNPPWVASSGQGVIADFKGLGAALADLGKNPKGLLYLGGGALGSALAGGVLNVQLGRVLPAMQPGMARLVNFASYAGTALLLSRLPKDAKTRRQMLAGGLAVALIELVKPGTTAPVVAKIPGVDKLVAPASVAVAARTPAVQAQPGAAAALTAAAPPWYRAGGNANPVNWLAGVAEGEPISIDGIADDDGSIEGLADDDDAMGDDESGETPMGDDEMSGDSISGPGIGTDSGQSLVMTYLNGLGCPLTGRSNSLNSLVRP